MSSNSQKIINKEKQVSANNYHPLPVVIKKGRGVWVEDVEGKKYLDMLSAYSALNQGHCHPKIVQAAKSQLDNLTLTSRAFHNDKMAPYLEKLCAVTGFEKALLMNSGAEAVETAIKAVRKWGVENKGITDGEIIVMASNFHGRTTAIISFSTDEISRDGYGPFISGFKTVEYGNINALKSAMTKQTIAVLMEPIQGEAGVMIPPEGYLESCAKTCAEHEVLLIIDEIQTGLGRTGAMFCYEHANIKPDIVIIGKALGGGVYPVSGILASSKIMDVAFTPGSHGSTFGGNPLACVVASAALDVIIDEKLIEKSKQLGDYFKNELCTIQSAEIKEVRGKGLMIAIELAKKAKGARYYTEQMLEKGILAKGTHDTIIRFSPPLIIEKAEIDWAVKIIKTVFS
ncbi:MAG: ornithine--oxo-acid transaminase [Glaciecola sp.]|jgi:ornithine--oxo-acid transaminase